MKSIVTHSKAAISAQANTTPQAKLRDLIGETSNDGRGIYGEGALLAFVDSFLNKDGSLAKATWKDLALLLSDYSIDPTLFLPDPNNDEFVGIELTPYFKDDELVSLGLALYDLDKHPIPDFLSGTSFTSRAWDDLNSIAMLFSFSEEIGNDLFIFQKDSKDFQYLYSSYDARHGDPVPEPATMLLFGTGLLGFAGISIRRRNK